MGKKEINFILEADEEDIFYLYEAILNRWLDKLGDSEGLFKVKEAYNYLPTDKQKIELFKELKEDYKRYYKK